MKESSNLARVATAFSPAYQSFLSLFPIGALVLTLTACGGGDSKVLGNDISNTSQSSSSVNSGWRSGVYKNSAEFKNLCAAPRTGVSEYAGEPFPDKKGTAIDEKNFLRSWSYETYLWFEELPDLNPGSNSTPQQYFELLKTNRTTSLGTPKDEYHFYLPTEEAEAGDAGVEYGYGMRLKADSTVPERKFYVAYVEPGSPAANAGVTRGARILEIDSYSLLFEESDAGLLALNEGLFPSKLGAAHNFKIQDAGSTSSRNVTLQSTKVVTSPVLLTKVLDVGEDKVGYVVFNSHIEKAQDQWVTAINELKQAGVSDVILDLRYNGGGLLSIASQVSYMLAGANVKGKVFSREIQNSKQKKLDPFPFLDFGLYDNNAGLDLPTLDLKRVYILSSNNTCSASETIINGLRGVDVQVYLIGDVTCGKPYGFYAQPNCGTTYYTIQLKVANAKDFGEYSDGFIPSSRPNNQAQIQGCFVADDLGYPLGDSREAMLATALNFRENGVCPATNTSRLQKPGVSINSGRLIEPEVRKLLLLK